MQNMTRWHRLCLSLATISLWCGACAAHALDEPGAKLVIEKFLSSQKLDGASASPGQHVITDLDGDGRADIVLTWDVLGPTWSRPKLTIMLDQGRTYRSLTTDLAGQTEKLTVNGSLITIDTLTLGPKDARCCPSVKTQLRYRWQGGKLTGLR